MNTTIYSYTNEIQSKNDKIELEQRRRNQIYMKLDYLLSVITYFDFFSLDAFKTIRIAKEISKIYNSKVVTSEFLLLAFLYSNSHLTELLEENEITKEKLLNLLSLEPEKKKKLTVNFSFFKQLKFYFNLDQKNEEVIYSDELNFLFEKAADNSLNRFKTPIISSEILFLTLLESKNTKAVKIIKDIIVNNVNWYVLRYKLIKRIHNEESCIRENVTKNQQYFAYLLKTQLTENEFERLMKNELITTGVSLFRNTLISKVLKVNLFELLNRDIHKSIQVTNKRSYSK